MQTRRRPELTKRMYAFGRGMLGSLASIAANTGCMAPVSKSGGGGGGGIGASCVRVSGTRDQREPPAREPLVCLLSHPPTRGSSLLVLAFLRLHAVARRSGVWQCGEAARRNYAPPFPLSPFCYMYIMDYICSYLLDQAIQPPLPTVFTS